MPGEELEKSQSLDRIHMLPSHTRESFHPVRLTEAKYTMDETGVRLSIVGEPVENLGSSTQLKIPDDVGG